MRRRNSWPIPSTPATIRQLGIWSDHVQSGIWSEVVKYLQPHPEERRIHAARLEGWPLARPSLLPSFETRASKSAVADFDTFRLPKSDRPDFGARSFRMRSETFHALS